MMDIKQLFDDEQAVSPVIGVILMVAITVILAAVIGTFVLGLGDQVQNTSPQASFNFEYLPNGGTNDEAQAVITHDGGDQISGSQVSNVVEGPGSYSTTSAWPSDISAGSASTVQKGGGSATSWAGETIRVVWTSDDGSSSQTIGRATAPN